MSLRAWLRAGGTSGWEPSGEGVSSLLLMQQAGRSAGNTIRIKGRLQSSPHGPTGTLSLSNLAPHGWGQSQSLCRSSGGFEARI